MPARNVKIARKPWMLMPALVLLGTVMPGLATSLGMTFSTTAIGGAAVPFLSWGIGGVTLLIDPNSFFAVVLIGVLGWLHGRFGHGKFPMVMGVSFVLAGMAATFLIVPRAGTGAGPHNALHATAAVMNLARLGGALVLVLGVGICRWGKFGTSSALRQFSVPGAALLALTWVGMGAGWAVPLDRTLPLAWVTLGLLAVVGSLCIHQMRAHRQEYFGLGILLSLAPLAAGQFQLADPEATGFGRGLYVAVMLQWFAYLVAAVGSGADLLRILLARSMSGEQKYLRSVIDAIPHFIFVRDTDGRFTLVNQAVADFYGMQVHEVEGQILGDIHPDREQVEKWLMEDQQTLDRGAQWQLPLVPTLDAEGDEHWVAAVKTPLDPSHSGMWQVLGVSIDITEQKLAERALADNLQFERTTSAILERFVTCTQADLPAVLDEVMAQTAGFTGADRCLLYRFDSASGDAQRFHGWNPQGADFLHQAPERIAALHLGWAAQMFANRLSLTAAGPDDLPAEAAGFWQALGLAPDRALLAVPVHLKGNLFGFLAVAAVRPHRWRREDSGLLRLVADLFLTVWSKLQVEHSLKQAMAAAQLSSQAKSEFLANMSHEIRTPLNCVIGITDLLAEMDPSPGQSQYLEMIRQSGASLLNLINDILDLSKIEAGQLELDPMVTSLRPLIDEIAGLSAFTAQAKGLEMVCRLAPGCPDQVVIDPLRLRQVLTNLLNNATKFTRQGHVYLNVEPVGESDGALALRFQVSDTGIGIEQDQLQKVFEKFTQADASTTRRFGGTGLGLSISQQLVGLMGGKITAHSRPGEGASFEFTIPVRVAAPAQDPTREAAAAVPGPRTAPQHVMVVTGHRLSGEVLAEQVRWLGHECSVAVGFDDALPMLDGPPRAGRVPWSFILLDQGVAEQEVPAINRHLEALPAGRRPVVVLMTSLSSQQRERDLKGMGFSGTLVKPVSPVRLAAVLDGTPDRPQGIVQLALPGQEDEAATPFGSGFGPTGAEAAAEGDGGAGSGPLVLLAEDNPFNQKVAGSMLRLLGCRVKIAANGVEAVAMAQQGDFDLVFMDCQMPAMDGYEATRRIRLLPGPRSGVRVIAMTANVMSGDRQACFAAGMDDFLSKPINKGTLAGMLEKWKIAPETVSAGPA